MHIGEIVRIATLLLLIITTANCAATGLNRYTTLVDDIESEFIDDNKIYVVVSSSYLHNRSTNIKVAKIYLQQTCKSYAIKEAYHNNRVYYSLLDGHIPVLHTHVYAKCDRKEEE
jgi:prepilin-type processing-associated H-X9-DG protein